MENKIYCKPTSMTVTKDFAADLLKNREFEVHIQANSNLQTNLVLIRILYRDATLERTQAQRAHPQWTHASFQTQELEMHNKEEFLTKKKLGWAWHDS